MYVVCMLVSEPVTPASEIGTVTSPSSAPSKSQEIHPSAMCSPAPISPIPQDKSVSKTV